MAELLASKSDVEGFLPDDKLQYTEGDAGTFQVDAVQLIRGQLASSFTPVVLVGWNSPSNTPQLIRQIAARLIAAQIYKKAYSEERSQLPQYAQDLYDQAIAMLTEIRSGNMIVTDEDGNPIAVDELALTNANFWPNNTTPGPYFDMTTRFS